MDVRMYGGEVGNGVYDHNSEWCGEAGLFCNVNCEIRDNLIFLPIGPHTPLSLSPRSLH